MNRFLAGVGRALLFNGNNLIGVAKTLTDSTFDFSITGEEIRGGSGNALWGKYFHDSNLNVTLTDAMFKLEYVAASLGVNIEMGGLSVYESAASGDAVVAGGIINLSNAPVAFDGSLIGWYKKPSDADWTIGTISGTTMSIPGAQVGETYCVKYFYQNPNARQVTIPTQYVPAELHVVILNDLFNGDISQNASETSKVGRLITDIPRLQMDGNQNFALSATSSATVSLTGSALAVSAGDGCEEDTYYGTMTEEIFGATWQDNVIALAVENSEIELAQDGTETLIVRVVYGGSVASQRKDNSNFTFTSSAIPTASVGANDGVVVGGSTSGDAYITVELTGYNVAPAIVKVTVA